MSVFLIIELTWVVQEKYTNSQLAETEQMNEVICPAGQISELVLADGTKVWLNAGSKISYPPNFSSRQRSLHLTGEAFFEVRKDQKNPFLVHTKTMDIKVLGTSFNVDAYGENQFVKTTLVKGKAEIQNKTGQKIAAMVPGQIARYDIASQKIVLMLSVANNIVLAQSDFPGFLQGTWKMEGKETYEHWDRLNANSLKGCSYEVQNRQITISEYLDISRTENGIIYTATVINQNQGNEINFNLTQSDSIYTFENPDHDFPKKIVYKKTE